MEVPAELPVALLSGHLDIPRIDTFIGVRLASSIGSCSPWSHGSQCH